MEGNGGVPFFFSLMQKETIIRAIEDKVNKILEGSPSHFLVEVRIKPTNNVKVFIDGDTGVILSELIQYNRQLYKQLEESAMFPDGDFSLEVSSPGLDEPLKLFRQYKKNLGRFVELTLNDGSTKEGKLLEAAEAGILIETETGKGKKKLVIAGLWTSVCIVGPVLSALADGYDVYVITDASGDVSKEAHDMAIQRMLKAGAKPMTATQYVLELQRDWARSETYAAVTGLFKKYGGAYGIGIAYAHDMFKH